MADSIVYMGVMSKTKTEKVSQQPEDLNLLTNVGDQNYQSISDQMKRVLSYYEPWSSFLCLREQHAREETPLYN